MADAVEDGHGRVESGQRRRRGRVVQGDGPDQALGEAPETEQIAPELRVIAVVVLSFELPQGPSTGGRPGRDAEQRHGVLDARDAAGQTDDLPNLMDARVGVLEGARQLLEQVVQVRRRDELREALEIRGGTVELARPAQAP